MVRRLLSPSNLSQSLAWLKTLSLDQPPAIQVLAKRKSTSDSAPDRRISKSFSNWVSPSSERSRFIERACWVFPQLHPPFEAPNLDPTSEGLWPQLPGGLERLLQAASPSTIESSPNSPRTPPTPPTLAWASKEQACSYRDTAKATNSSIVGSKAQCATSRGAKLYGDTGLMSQRGTTSLPPSRPSSRSSPNKTIFPEQLRPDVAAPPSGLVRPDIVVPPERAELGVSRTRSRSTIGDVLNPTEQHNAPPEQRQILGRPAGGQALGPTLAPAAAPKAFNSQTQHPGTEQQLGRGPPPAMPDGSRRILSPRGPRAASASYAHSHFTLSPQLTTSGHEHPPNLVQTSKRTQTHQLPPLSSAASLPGTPSVSAPQPARTNSQPLLGPSGSAGPAPFAPAAQRRPWPTPGQPSQAQSTSDGSSGFPRSVSTSGVTSPAGWQNLLRDRQGLASAEGTEVLTGRLPDGSEIPVTLDMTTGSARQSQKRSRNAEASGRHRSKRKAQTSDMQKEIEALKEEREIIQGKMEELVRERDFYRDDRNRLREIVGSTAQIAHMANGPQSPGASVTQIGRQPKASGISEQSATAHRQHFQSYPMAHPGREGHGETANRHDTNPPVQLGGYDRPALPREDNIGQAGNVPYAPDHRLPAVAAARTGPSTQLPPIGVMGGTENRASHGQNWEQDHQHGHWPRTQSRSNPGWATGRQEQPGPPPQ